MEEIDRIQSADGRAAKCWKLRQQSCRWCFDSKAFSKQPRTARPLMMLDYLAARAKVQGGELMGARH